MSESKQERLEYLADILAAHCCADKPCIFNSISMCPFGYYNCGDITSADWLKYMQGLEVSEL